MKNYIEQRVLEIANYCLNNNATVRESAKRFGISKSTVHKDITERLPELNHELYEEVKKVLETSGICAEARLPSKNTPTCRIINKELHYMQLFIYSYSLHI